MIPVFQELSEKIGKQKVIWRYDPIFFSDRYTKEYHLKAFKSTLLIFDNLASV